MTKEEIKKFLDNTKVYVNGKSEEIQKKLFSFGYYWYGNNYNKVQFTKEPFLFISDDNIITHSDFTNHKFTEITAEQILSLELTKGYRPFKDKNECWNEMLKHQPFGWLKSKKDGRYRSIGELSWSDELETVYIAFSTSEALSRCVDYVFDEYTFADGAPFGIKEE